MRCSIFEQMTHTAHDALATVVGSLGVAFLLLAFLLNLLKILRSEGYAYMTLNVIGASMACYSSYLLAFMPFVLLEAVWALVAAGGLARAFATRGRVR